MVEKRKRSPARWLADLDWWQIAFKIMWAALALALAVFIVWLIHEGRMSAFATCDYFINRQINEIPLRCLKLDLEAGQ